MQSVTIGFARDLATYPPFFFQADVDSTTYEQLLVSCEKAGKQQCTSVYVRLLEENLWTELTPNNLDLVKEGVMLMGLFAGEANNVDEVLTRLDKLEVAVGDGVQENTENTHIEEPRTQQARSLPYNYTLEQDDDVNALRVSWIRMTVAFGFINIVLNIVSIVLAATSGGSGIQQAAFAVVNLLMGAWVSSGLNEKLQLWAML